MKSYNLTTGANAFEMGTACHLHDHTNHWFLGLANTSIRSDCHQHMTVITPRAAIVSETQHYVAVHFGSVVTAMFNLIDSCLPQSDALYPTFRVAPVLSGTMTVLAAWLLW